MYSKISWSLALFSILAIGSIGAAQSSPQEKMQEAQAASQSGNYDKAVKLLRELEESMPDQPGVLFLLGYNLHASGKIDEAIQYHERAAKQEPFRVTALYNLACAYSLKNNKDKAFDYLEKSIEAGYQNPEQIEHAKSDADFKNIKNDPRFAEMIAMMENGGKKPGQKKKLEKKDLFGSWKVFSGMRAGSASDSSRLPTIKFEEKTVTIPAGEDGTFVMAYKLDFDAKPIQVDFQIESGPVPEGNAKGIIKFENDVLTLCYEPTGQDRPEKFESTEENNCFLFKMKKVETKADGIAAKMRGKWKCVKGLRGGDDVAAERMAAVISIDEKKIVIPVGPDQAFEMSYQIDAGKSPATIDMTIEAGPAPPDSKAVGIIKMEGKKLVLCYDPYGANRPDKFESTEENGQFLFEMEPAK